MNYYNISGLNGCFTLVLIGMIFMFLLRVFTGFIMATLPFWLALGVLLVLRNLYRSYITSRKPNVTVEEDFSSHASPDMEETPSFNPDEISRDAVDVEYVEYDEID